MRIGAYIKRILQVREFIFITLSHVYYTCERVLTSAKARIHSGITRFTCMF